MSVRLAKWEAKIGRILDKDNTGQKVYEISLQNNKSKNGVECVVYSN
jgi:hypothetical protein